MWQNITGCAFRNSWSWHVQISQIPGAEVSVLLPWPFSVLTCQQCVHCQLGLSSPQQVTGVNGPPKGHSLHLKCVCLQIPPSLHLKSMRKSAHSKEREEIQVKQNRMSEGKFLHTFTSRSASIESWKSFIRMKEKLDSSLISIVDHKW